MMKPMREQKLFVIALFIILLDQLTKLWIKGFHLFGFTHEGMILNSSTPVLGDLLRWTYVENPGMAFGVSFGPGKIILSLFSIVAAIALGWYLFKLRYANKWVQIGVMLLFAGAIGNLIDRVFYGVIFSEAPLFYGKVVDFIDVDCPDFSLGGQEITRWWVFNVADSCVSCGIVLLMLVNAKIPTFKSLKLRPELQVPIVVSDYDPEWPKQFAELQEVLSSSLSSKAERIEHVGSTSVPGLAAKAILDVDIVIADDADFAPVRQTLEALGYVYEGDKGIAQREAFRQADSMVPIGSGKRWMRQHVYVCPASSPALHEHLMLRDILRQHSELQAEYGALKRELAKKYGIDRDGYTTAKTDWIRGVLERYAKSGSEPTNSSAEDAPETENESV